MHAFDTPTPFGCLIVATGLARDPERAQRTDDHLDSLIATAALLGASPIVVVHDGTPRVAPPARSFKLPRAERDDVSAVRLGLMQFTNAPVGAALILPVEAHTFTPHFLRGMMTEAARRSLPLAAVATHGTLGLPMYATRDLWRELMTTEGGLPTVLRTLGPKVLALEVE